MIQAFCGKCPGAPSRLCPRVARYGSGDRSGGGCKQHPAIGAGRPCIKTYSTSCISATGHPNFCDDSEER